mgnify:CR=1 FL=1
MVVGGGAGLAALAGEVAKTVGAAREHGGELGELAQQLDSTWQRIVSVTAAMFGAGDIDAALANSSIYLEAFGHAVLAWIWLEQALAADGN